MSADLPSTRPQLDIAAFRQFGEILSGDGAVTGVKERGIRGLSSALNYGYAQGRVLCSDAHPTQASGTNIFESTSATWVDVFEVAVDQYIGADVDTIEVLADVTDGEVRLSVAGSPGSGSGSATGRSDHTATASVTGGAQRTIMIQAQRDAAASKVQIHGYRVREQNLTAGDLP